MGSWVVAVPGASARAGLTIIEVVVSLALLALSFVVLVGAIRSNDAVAAHAREQTHAANAAESVLEDVLSEAWDDLPSRNGETFPVAIEVAPGRTAALAPGAGRTAPGLVVVQGAGADLRLVEVSVTWRGSSGEARTALRTLVARH